MYFLGLLPNIKQKEVRGEDCTVCTILLKDFVLAYVFQEDRHSLIQALTGLRFSVNTE